MKTKKERYFVGDFETTVFEGQTSTEVWASAIVEMFTEDVFIFHSLPETLNYLFALKENVTVYYHNLKFDGSFYMSYILNTLHLTPAFVSPTGSDMDLHKLHDNEMPNNSFNYNINAQGEWYTITFKIHNKIICLKDSLKLLPFSVAELGTSFQTTHKKLDMEYKGYRYAGCEITDSEKEYISNDVLVVKEALEIMFNEGHRKLTIGACCLSEFHSMFFENHWKALFPNLTEIPISFDDYDSTNVDEYIRKSYKGGWCYIVPKKAGKLYSKKRKGFTRGTTADVNSLYPSVMHSDSGNVYPYGKPTFWKGDIPEFLTRNKKDYYFFVRIKTRFKIKKNMLPCIQIKRSALYRSTQWLETSDVYNKKTGKYTRFYRDRNDLLHDSTVILTLTTTDYDLIREHYDLLDMEILDGCYFKATAGLFDEYINKYKEIKMNSKGARRTLAKLFLNNLYGKFATSTNSSFKYAYIEDNVVKYYTILEHEKKPLYIPVGSAVTSYARNFTIRAAQMNYHGANKPGFIYADTDSIHCDVEPEKLVGIKVHPSDFNCWKLEATWDEGIFARQKTYIEHVIEEDLHPVDTPYYNVKCAGMPKKCKDLFVKSIAQKTETEWVDELTQEVWDKFTNDEKDFILTPRKLSDFKVGLKVPGKLLPKAIKGGTLLTETTYEMRNY